MSDIVDAFRMFLSDGVATRAGPLKPFVRTIDDMHNFFELQKKFRFVGSSLLFVYDGAAEPSAEPPKVGTNSACLGHARVAAPALTGVWALPAG